jgi:probable blue pigment (indigoidine) exporter
VILLPLALIMEPALPPLTATNLAGLLWLGVIGAAASYVLWFRGVARLEPGAVSMLGMMSPVTAVLLGWVVLGQSLSPLQGLGAAIVLGSVWAGQRANRPSTDTTPVLPNPSPPKAA